MALPFPVCEDGYFDLTPDLATRLLKTQVANRPIKPASVAYLSRQLREGRWRDSARFLGFNEEDQLVDGQHLCTAVVETGISAKTRAARIRSSDVLAVDTGTTRSAGDLLTMRNIANGARIVGILRLVRSMEACEGEKKLSRFAGRLLSNEEVWTQVHAEPEFIDSAQAAVELAKYVPYLGPAEVGALHHLMRTRAGDDRAVAFWDALSDPDEDTSLHRLRRYLLQAQSAQRKPARAETISRVVAVWNRWLADAPGVALPLPRKFPVIEPRIPIALNHDR